MSYLTGSLGIRHTLKRFYLWKCRSCEHEWQVRHMRGAQGCALLCT